MCKIHTGEIKKRIQDELYQCEDAVAAALHFNGRRRRTSYMAPNFPSQ